MSNVISSVGHLKMCHKGHPLAALLLARVEVAFENPSWNEARVAAKVATILGNGSDGSCKLTNSVPAYLLTY